MKPATQVHNLCRSNDLIAVFAFGSRSVEAAARLRGENMPSERSDSDLDLGILLPQEVEFDLRQIINFAIAVEDLFNVPRADIVDLRSAPPYLALDAIRGERLYCAGTYETDVFELFVLRRAADLAPYERERRKMLLTPASAGS